MMGCGKIFVSHPQPNNISDYPTSAPRRQSASQTDRFISAAGTSRWPRDPGSVMVITQNRCAVGPFAVSHTYGKKGHAGNGALIERILNRNLRIQYAGVHHDDRRMRT